MRILLLAPLLLVVACGPTEDCCAPDPVDPTPSASSSDTAAEAFVAYAEGGEPAVPWAGLVRFSIRVEQVAEFDAGFADRRATWAGCPPGETTYEQRPCPVSPLGTIRGLRSEGVTTVLESTAPDIIGCNRYTAPTTDAVSTTWIRPDVAHRTCFTDYAIAVGVDASGDVTDVDLAISGP